MGLLDGKKIVITGVLTDASLAYGVARLARRRGRRDRADRGWAGAVAHAAHSTQARRRHRRVRVRRHRARARPLFVMRWRRSGVTSTACSTRSGSLPRCCLGDDFIAAPWDDVAVAMHISTYSLKALADTFLPVDGEPAARSSGSTSTTPSAWPAYNWMGVAKSALAERVPISRQGARSARDPVEPRRRRSDQDDGREVDPRLRPVRGRLGRAGAARLGRHRTPNRSPRRASPCCRTGSPRRPVRSSTSTADSTPPASEPASV